MSDETPPDETPTDMAAAGRAARSRPGALTHASDLAVRPGFRNPATKKSAARQKAKKGK